jgi:phytoene/squalene synthetase
VKLPFFIRRPWLVVRGTTANRDTPDLEALAAIEDPEEFVWAILPHAARSFATSILVLPRREAWAAAIAYLYCRILDTYEDLHPDVAARPKLLRSFGARFGTDRLDAPPVISADLARDDRDRGHLLLIERIGLIDSAFCELEPVDRASIAELVHNMADGMAWASETLATQDGVLSGADQRARYCHYVIGEPALYAMRSLLHLPVTAARRTDALRVSEMIQLANITRDIEKDLVAGLAYHPALRPDLGATVLDTAAEARVRRVREELLLDALSGVDAYARLVGDLASSGVSQARGAAVLMLNFTDRYYSRCARRAGHAGWPGARRSIVIYTNAILATLSARWAQRIVDGIVEQFHRATQRIGGPPAAPH